MSEALSPPSRPPLTPAEKIMGEELCQAVAESKDYSMDSVHLAFTELSFTMDRLMELHGELKASGRKIAVVHMSDAQFVVLLDPKGGPSFRLEGLYDSGLAFPNPGFRVLPILAEVNAESREIKTDQNAGKIVSMVRGQGSSH